MWTSLQLLKTEIGTHLLYLVPKINMVVEISSTAFEILLKK